MKTLLETLLIALIMGGLGMAMGWAMDKQIVTHTYHVLQQVQKMEGITQ